MSKEKVPDEKVPEAIVEAPPSYTSPEILAPEDTPLAQLPKSRWERSWPVVAAGSGLFSDGYLNNVIGSVNTMLGVIYTTEYTQSPAQSNVSAIAFAGTVVGQLVFGVTSDYWGRAKTLLLSTYILILFAILGTASYGAGGSTAGLFAALTAYRFFLGIGIGGEYPAGSVACAEATGELKRGHRNRWFIFSTNFAIDMGFVVSAIVPMIVVLITTENHLRVAWRICLGIGVIPPLSLLYLRTKLKEPESFQRNKMTKYPYGLILRFYGFRLAVVSLIWFIYDFISYAFGIYGSKAVYIIIGESAPLWKVFGWNTIINLFYIPGAFIGAFLSDWIGPRYALALGVTLQAIVGFILAALYGTLDTPSHVAGFVVAYGIFLCLGEIGPGDNIGLIASKTSATSIRGQYYAIAAALGKIGAFVGTKVFPYLETGTKVQAGQRPFWVACSLCIVSAALTLFCLPHIGQDTIEEEDIKFTKYLAEKGYDVSMLGTKDRREERRASAVAATQEVSS